MNMNYLIEENINKIFVLLFIFIVFNRKINKYTYKLINNLTFFYKNLKVNNNISVNTRLVIDPIVNEVKYEDKYIDQYNLLSNEYYFSLEEKNLISKKIAEFQLSGIEDYSLKATEFVFDEKIKKLKHSYVMEYTPLGNVIMKFDNEKSHFEYYSDSTIPYKFLETIARRFVIIHNCKQIFIDMQNELNKYEEYIKKIEEQEEIDKKKDIENKEKLVPKKKNVFAKLKNYNNDIVTTRIGAAQSIPPKTNSTVNTTDKKKFILKEKSNKYSYKGKILNFNILTKVDKSISNKKLKLSFADYKKLNKLVN